MFVGVYRPLKVSCPLPSQSFEIAFLRTPHACLHVRGVLSRRKLRGNPQKQRRACERLRLPSPRPIQIRAPQTDTTGFPHGRQALKRGPSVTQMRGVRSAPERHLAWLGVGFMRVLASHATSPPRASPHHRERPARHVRDAGLVVRTRLGLREPVEIHRPDAKLVGRQGCGSRSRMQASHWLSKLKHQPRAKARIAGRGRSFAGVVVQLAALALLGLLDPLRP